MPKKIWQNLFRVYTILDEPCLNFIKTRNHYFIFYYPQGLSVNEVKMLVYGFWQLFFNQSQTIWISDWSFLVVKQSILCIAPFMLVAYLKILAGISVSFWHFRTIFSHFLQSRLQWIVLWPLRPWEHLYLSNIHCVHVSFWYNLW